MRGAGRARPRRRPRAGHRPPRPQAREPVRHEGRAREDPGLRSGAAGGRRRTRGTGATETLTRDTEPGDVLGTVGLHVARSRCAATRADHRSDIFSLGAVLYEMLSGRRAFQRDTAAETLNAILKEDPPELRRGPADPAGARPRRAALPGEEAGGPLPVGARPGVRPGGLLRDTERRAGEAAAASPAPTVGGRGSRRARLVAALRRGCWRGRAPRCASRAATQPDVPPWRRSPARFAPDGQTIFYSAAWDGRARRDLSPRTTPGVEALGLPPGHVLAVSSKGEMALLLRGHPVPGFSRGRWRGRPSPAAPRARSPRTSSARDWAPTARASSWSRPPSRLQFPTGRVLHAPGQVDLLPPRVSPRAETGSLLRRLRGRGPRELPGSSRAGGVDATRAQSLRGPGLPRDASSGSAARTGTPRQVCSRGGERLLGRIPGRGGCWTCPADGRPAARAGRGRRSACVRAGPARRRSAADADFDLRLSDLADDGRPPALGRCGHGAGRTPAFTCADRRLPPGWLGDGDGQALSPDGRFAGARSILARGRPSAPPRPHPGGARRAERPASDQYSRAVWDPAGRKVDLFTRSRARRG